MFPIPTSFRLFQCSCTHQAGRVLIWAGGGELACRRGPRIEISSFPPFLRPRKRVHGGVLEGTVRERERLVADGGEGKGRERRREDICPGRRRMGKEEEKGVERSAEIG